MNRRFGSMLQRVLLAVAVVGITSCLLQSRHLVDAQEYDCSFPTAMDVSRGGDQTFLFRHSIHPELQVINVELEYKGAGWVGISFAGSTSMIGNIAVIGLPDDGTVLKYNLAGKQTSLVTPIDSDTLTDTSIVYNPDTGSTILKFTKPLVETGETTISESGENIILVAYGASNTLATHASRNPISAVTLKECVLAGTTATPVAAPPPTAPVAVVTPPVASPTTNAGNTSNVVDLGNGRIERLLSFEEGDLAVSILTDIVDETLTVNMVYAGLAWLGFAISDDELMPNSNAVMAFPTGATGAAEKWDIGDGRSEGFVMKVTDATRQATLTDATYTQNDTHTVMTFTKPLFDGSEIPVVIDKVNFFLYAIGFDNEFGIHRERLGFALDLAATTLDDVNTSSPDTKSLWMVHGILMFIAWSIFVPLAVGTALLRNFLPLPNGMWFQIHRILNSIAVLCTIAGFSIAVHNINEEQGSTAKHFSTYQHHTIGLVIFIFAIVQSLTGIFRPHLPKPAATAASEDPDEEDGKPKTTESDDPPKKSPSRIAFEIQHRLMGTAAMILGFFNVDSGIGLYSQRFNTQDLAGVPWAISGGIVMVTLILVVVDRYRKRPTE